MVRVSDPLEPAFRRAATRLLPPGTAVVAAVSGGADSIALLHLLARLAGSRAARMELAVAHLDHGLRRGSAADRRFVEHAARDLGLRCWACRIPVSERLRRGESLEEGARRVRRAFLLEARERLHGDLIATGHHLDDQAETVLLRLARGAGPSALAGMAERGPGPFVRPLLTFERAQLRAWLDRRGLAFREDPSNRDLRFDRNRLRHRVVPVLEAEINPRAARHVVRAAARLREDAAVLDELAAELLLRVLLPAPPGEVVLRVGPWTAAPSAIARRLARLALGEAGIDPRSLSSRIVDALVDLARGPRGRRLDLPGGRVAARLPDRVRVTVL